MKKPISEILGGLLDTLPNVFTINDFVIVNANTTEIVVCDPLWAYISPTAKVSNSGNEFNIANISYADNTYTITLNGTGFNSANATTLQRPSYFHGTRLQTNKELLNNRTGNNKGEKYPILYLYEVLAEEFFTQRSNSAFERESDLRLFFLSEADGVQWSTHEHYENAINPMSNLAHLFTEHIDKQPKFRVDERYKITYLANFGNTNAAGNFEKIFTDLPLSGAELTITITKRKDNECPC